MTLPEVPDYSYPEIKEYANNFLSTYNPSGQIPINIDLIAENNLKLNIIPIPSFPEAIDGGGFLSALTDIYVDEYVLDRNEGRYRFTIAHEIGHLILHREYYEALNISCIEDYVNYLETVDNITIGCLESSANNFAGLVLVPTANLQSEYSNCVAEILLNSEQLKKHPDILNDLVCNKLARTYLVNRTTVRIRIDRERLRSNL